MITRVKGTQDFLDLTLYNYVTDTIKHHLQTYHFTQIATPILEPVDLFKRSLGMYTDVVTKEMFLIDTGQEEKKERICLRPEATVPTVRAFIENGVQHIPWKVFSYGPMFRYERPQKGRYRQFHQVNIEVIGALTVFEDVQLIKMLDRLFHEVFNLNNYALLINFLGCAQDRVAYREKLKKFLESPKAEGICDTCQVRKETNIMRIFDCKNPQCQTIYLKAPFISDNICKACQKEWHELQKQLSLLSVTFAHKPTLVRGLDYYNKTVFEFASQNLGAQNAFCGGGRYDQLVKELGGKQDLPSLGAAIGIERLMLLLEPMKDTLALPTEPPLQVILPLSEDQYPLALILADTLQDQKLCVDVLYGGSLKSMMRKANKMGATNALLLGDQEQETKTVLVKNMVTGAQESIAQTELVELLKK